VGGPLRNVFSDAGQIARFGDRSDLDDLDDLDAAQKRRGLRIHHNVLQILTIFSKSLVPGTTVAAVLAT
jgi:hypothetical protein